MKFYLNYKYCSHFYIVDNIYIFFWLVLIKMVKEKDAMISHPKKLFFTIFYKLLNFEKIYEEILQRRNVL